MQQIYEKSQDQGQTNNSESQISSAAPRCIIGAALPGIFRAKMPGGAAFRATLLKVEVFLPSERGKNTKKIL